MMELSKVEVNKEVVIVDCHLPEEMKERMFALGLVTGQHVRLIRRGMGGDPLQIRLGATELMLRKNVAEHIEVAEAETVA